MTNPISWDYLTAPLDQTPTFGPFSTAYLVLFVLVFLFSIVVYFGAGWRLKHNPILQRSLRTGSQWMLWITAIGLFFFAFRWMRVEIFTLYMRIWLYLVALVFVGALVYFAYYLKEIYPRKIERVQRRRQMRQYMPGATMPRPKDAPRHRKAKQGVRTSRNR